MTLATTVAPPPLAEVLKGLSAEADGRKPFIAGKRELSWADFRDAVGRTRTLFDTLGVGVGDRVATLSHDDVVVAQVYGACLLSGAVAVVMDPDSSASEANVLLTKARVSAIVADQAAIDRAGELQADTAVPVLAVSAGGPAKSGFGLLTRRSKRQADETSFQSMVAAQEPVTGQPDLPNDAPALILFTSGTTSQPKGVVLTRGNLAAQIMTFGSHMGYHPGSRLVNHLPLHHTDGLNKGPLMAMGHGCTWLRPEAVDMQSLGDMLDLCQRQRATNLITVPTVLAMMTRLPEAYDDAFGHDEFEFIASSAGYLHEELWRSLEDRFSTMIVNSYGMTETVMEAIYCGPSDDTRRLGTIGKPVDTAARIVDNDGNDVAPGDVGELWISGTNVMAGYFENPEATAAVMTDGWVATGDLAKVDADGFYTIAGRKKNVIIRGGVNVYPEDVNAELMEAPGVAAAATVGVPDSFLGEQVVACITANGTVADDALVDGAMEHCRENLAAEKVPNRIFVLDALPTGPSGKVELKKLLQIATESMGGKVEGSSTREQVLNVAATVFGHPVEELSEASTRDTTDGWDSLTFLELIMGLERQFDMSIAPRDVMTLTSLSDAIALVENR